MRLRAFSILAGTGTVFAVQIFLLDCSECPLSCNNDCYATFVAGAPAILDYDQPDTATTKSRRKASGCTQSNGLSVCGDNGQDPYKNDGDECDEYPYASVSQGGTGAILRCVPGADNGNEGGQLSGFYAKEDDTYGCSGEKCQFKIMLKEDTYTNSYVIICSPLVRIVEEFKL